MRARYGNGVSRPSSHTVLKALLQSGKLTKHAARELVRRGRVSLNGEVVLDEHTSFDPSHDILRLKGREVRPAHFGAVLLSKPAGLRCEMEGGDDLSQVVSRKYRSFLPVYALAARAAGLVLLSNDPALRRGLLHGDPDLWWTLQFDRRVAAGVLERLERGLRTRSRTLPCRVQQVADSARGSQVTLRCGSRGGELWEFFERIDLTPQAVVCTGFRHFRLGGMRPGEVRALPERQYQTLIARIEEREAAALARRG